MSINPALTSGPVQGTWFPAPYQGEFIFAARDKVDFAVEGVNTKNKKYKSSGMVFLSNLRLVFVAAKRDEVSGIHAIELPYMFITEDATNQPIFGANNLSGTCKFVDSTDKLKFKLLFISGGLGTLVPLFYSSLAYTRRLAQSNTAQLQPQQEVPTKVAGDSHAYQQQQQAPPSFVCSAFVDPNDPTKVYTTQQVPENERLQSTPPYPIV